MYARSVARVTRHEIRSRDTGRLTPATSYRARLATSRSVRGVEVTKPFLCTDCELKVACVRLRASFLKAFFYIFKVVRNLLSRIGCNVCATLRARVSFDRVAFCCKTSFGRERHLIAFKCQIETKLAYLSSPFVTYCGDKR